MNAIIIAVIGHLANAIASLIDKVLLKTGFKQPASYAITIGGLSALSLVAWPFFGIENVDLRIIVHAILFGACFFGGLWRFFAGLKTTEAGSFVPLTAAAVAVMSLLLEDLLLWDFSTSASSLMILGGISLLIASMALIAYANRSSDQPVALQPALESAAFFAISSVNAAFLYHETDFVQGFFLSRVVVLVCVIGVLIAMKDVRQELFTKKKGEKKPFGLFFLGQAIGGIGFFGVQYALSLGSASTVNALQAVQFGALALITGVFGKFLPAELRERWTGISAAFKLVAIACIAAGLALIAS